MQHCALRGEAILGVKWKNSHGSRRRPDGRMIEYLGIGILHQWRGFNMNSTGFLGTKLD